MKSRGTIVPKITAALLGFILAACGSDASPQSAPLPNPSPAESPVTGSPAGSQRVRDAIAACRESSIEAYERLNDFIVGGPTTPLDQLDSSLAELGANAQAVERELTKSGAIVGADKCLFAAAMDMEYIGGLLPEGQYRTQVVETARHYYATVRRYYPGSDWALQAQDMLDHPLPSAAPAPPAGAS